MPRQGRVDPSQPSPRAMHYIKNKNNITDMRLRRTLEGYDREKIQSITNIDHDRLDVKDFLKVVKHCSSDELPEARIWLGEKGEYKKRREREAAQRNIFTAPAGASKPRNDTRDIKTAPGAESDTKQGDDIVKVGIFFKKKRDVDPNRVHLDIYSKRNMYSSLTRERTGVFAEEARLAEEKAEEQQKQWAEEEERQRAKAEEDRKLKEEEEKKAELALAEEKRRSEAADVLTLDRRAPASRSADSDNQRKSTIRKEMRRIVGIGPQTELEKREARIRAMNDNAELMKDILIKNARRRASLHKKRKPLEDRIRTFFTRIDTLRREEEEDEQVSHIEQKRRYVLMTRGVKAALEIKDDEEYEDSNLHTL